MIVLRWAAALAGLVVTSAEGFVADDERGPVGHWKLAADGSDATGNRLDALNRGVTFGTRTNAFPATFDGRGGHFEVKPSPKLRLGTGDFSIALRLHTDPTSEDLGDLVTRYDPKTRTGFNLSLRTSTGVTSSTANVRQLQFGIDAGSEPRWTDEGRPGTAVLAFALAVHDGRLYAGAADNAPGATGRVYRFDGGGKWIDCGAPDRSNAIHSLVSHEGSLYAASGKYRFAGSSLPESENKHAGGGVFRHLGDQKWEEIGRLPNVEAVGGMVVYKGRLHASSLYKPAGFFRREADGSWTSLPVPDGKRVEALAAFDDHIWASSYDDGRVYRFDGKNWKDLGKLGENTQTYSFAVHRGRMCVGTWPSGKVYRWNEEKWDDIGRLGDELEVMGMLVHNGHLYGGTLPLGAVFRHDGERQWTKVARLDPTPNVKYRRAWTMASFDGRLFCSTLPSGKIHAMEAGSCVTFDHELPAGRQHVVAVKSGGKLRLYVNGKRVAESRPFDPAKFDLSDDSPLLIGSGESRTFRGSMSDVRLYRRALSEAEIVEMAKP